MVPSGELRSYQHTQKLTSVGEENQLNAARFMDKIPSLPQIVPHQAGHLGFVKQGKIGHLPIFYPVFGENFHFPQISNLGRVPCATLSDCPPPQIVHLVVQGSPRLIQSGVVRVFKNYR